MVNDLLNIVSKTEVEKFKDEVDSSIKEATCDKEIIDIMHPYLPSI